MRMQVMMLNDHMYDTSKLGKKRLISKKRAGIVEVDGINV